MRRSVCGVVRAAAAARAPRAPGRPPRRLADDRRRPADGRCRPPRTFGKAKSSGPGARPARAQPLEVRRERAHQVRAHLHLAHAGLRLGVRDAEPRPVRIVQPDVPDPQVAQLAHAHAAAPEHLADRAPADVGAAARPSSRPGGSSPSTSASPSSPRSAPAGPPLHSRATRAPSRSGRRRRRGSAASRSCTAAASRNAPARPSPETSATAWARGPACRLLRAGLRSMCSSSIASSRIAASVSSSLLQRRRPQRPQLAPAPIAQLRTGRDRRP